MPAALRRSNEELVVLNLRLTLGAGGTIARADALDDPGFGVAAAGSRAVPAACRAVPVAGESFASIENTTMPFRLRFVVD